MKISQHIPGFVDGRRPHVAEFQSADGLLSLPWVESWSHPYGRNFHRFSVSGSDLMAEFDGGDEWHVVGHIDGTRDEIAALGLPEWKITPAAQAKVDRWNRGEG